MKSNERPTNRGKTSRRLPTAMAKRRPGKRSSPNSFHHHPVCLRNASAHWTDFSRISRSLISYSGRSSRVNDEPDSMHPAGITHCYLTGKALQRGRSGRYLDISGKIETDRGRVRYVGGYRETGSGSSLTCSGCTGAGVSVEAGIPDFRSSDGIFQSLKRDNPGLASGKDLFNASVFKVCQAVDLNSPSKP